ncbi:MAG TPA: R2-like ligand-binding oxidase [Rhodothermales bacterium]|nr:R2-like ligand-binding oxidase [Rhodothermales bacterium]
MQTYRSTFKSAGLGLDTQLYPMRLWHKAKKLGIWNPQDLDFSRDVQDWLALTDRERDLLLRLTGQFQGGEESVTYDLLPLLLVMAEEGRLEEEMFLTSYLWEEAKHVEGFSRFLKEVTGTHGGLEHYYTDAYKTIFFDVLPRSMNRLREDRMPETLAEAAVTYQMIVEGVLAETGYHAYYTVLERHDLLPGLREMVRYIQRDESRHIGYGVFLLSRLVAEHGEAIWSLIDRQMQTLIPVAVQHIGQSLEPYGDDLPFGITVDEFIDFGMAQFQKRYARIERARRQSLEEVLYGRSSSGDGTLDEADL